MSPSTDVHNIWTLFVSYAGFIYYFNCISFAIRLSGRKVAIKLIDWLTDCTALSSEIAQTHPHTYIQAHKLRNENVQRCSQTTRQSIHPSHDIRQCNYRKSRNKSGAALRTTKAARNANHRDRGYIVLDVYIRLRYDSDVNDVATKTTSYVNYITNHAQFRR